MAVAASGMLSVHESCPETMSQDPNVPVTPTVYGPAKPLSKAPPPGSVAMPGATNNNNTNYTPVYNNTSQ